MGSKNAEWLGKQRQSANATGPTRVAKSAKPAAVQSAAITGDVRTINDRDRAKFQKQAKNGGALAGIAHYVAESTDRRLK